MNSDATSLARMHDLALPPAIGWWPLASAWYALIVLLLFAAGWIARRYWIWWKANGYRRQALALLETAEGPCAVAELLRRAALAAAPRAEIAERIGEDWVGWLEQQYAGTMLPQVRALLRGGIYGKNVTEEQASLLREYAAGWIAGHRAAGGEKGGRST
jgi:hypothetical protein